jgi:Mlc titration factor MtfA (ptsG expression regulator)
MRFETRARRRRRAAAVPFPEGWRDVLRHRWPVWATLDDDERSRLEHLVAVFVADKQWEAARRFEITDEVRVLVAAQACLLILGLDEVDVYGWVRTIIVHPSTVVLRGQRSTDIPGVMSDGAYHVLGEAHHHRGPVVLSWSAVKSDARHPARGTNVVLHEFAHKLDMLDGTVDGTPPLLDDERRRRWVRVCTRELRAIRAGTSGPLLRDYGGQDPGEFFAVATEVFFTRPVELREAKPQLYEVLADFYRQDPAGRALRSAR